MTRKGGNRSFPSSVTAIPVDYESLDSLTGALQGQDAVVSTISSPAIATQLLLVEAAAKAHVKRFIPSEFGGDTANPKTAALPVFKPKATVFDALKKEASSGGMTYTLIATGPFLEMGSTSGFVMNLKEKSINLYDGGERPFSITSLPTIGKAVVGVLTHPEETKNRAVYIHDTAKTSKELAAIAKQATGPEGWKEVYVSTDECLATAWEELKKEKPNPMVFFPNFIKACVWGEGYGSYFEKADNELLGLKVMSDAELQNAFSSLAK